MNFLEYLDSYLHRMEERMIEQRDEEEQRGLMEFEGGFEAEVLKQKFEGEV